MIDASAAGERIETVDDLGSGDAAKFAYWEMQEKIAEKEERAWIKRARDIVKRYRDERPQAGQTTTRFNILWSNVQTLLPTFYARTPKPDVERRFHDQDPVGRLAAILLERCLLYAVDAFSFDAVMRAVVMQIAQKVSTFNYAGTIHNRNHDYDVSGNLFGIVMDATIQQVQFHNQLRFLAPSVHLNTTDGDSMPVVGKLYS